MKKSRQPVIQSVDRAIKIISLFKEYNCLGITEISEKLDLAKSTVYGLIATLKKHGYLEQDRISNKYRLGLAFLELSSILYGRLNIREIASPIMQKMVDKYGETVQLSILDESRRNVVYVECIEASSGIKFSLRVGMSSPAHCVATGKVMLAEFSDEKIVQIFESGKLSTPTKNSISSISELKEHLSIVRVQGYSIDNEESEIGLKGLGAPIYNHLGKVVAGISIGGPKVRVKGDFLKELIEAIKQISSEISQRLGYFGDKT
ncbi:IclR family transcriptional regulator [Halocella sp. SP3-1]|uniref:IclR family transcriptional regulator n=1 Tax=Halocella sp. SP3-1 TaxID=2382161 RepID=UPI000F754228|nr:IclR family transcriptional regulator [Halocella sp. SP3-1]AZO96380.1 IclR family transcriptional regulator [Halocella sp. SP3-1]